MKSSVRLHPRLEKQSLPVRGAWIEISSDRRFARALTSLPVRGAWIEIAVSQSRSYHLRVSLPVRGAWIEIMIWMNLMHGLKRSLPVRGAWIEMSMSTRWMRFWTSLPVRGAWIEIYLGDAVRVIAQVAPRAGSVD